jgi:hypothetical protein
VSGGDAVLLVDVVAVRADGRDDRRSLALLALDEGTGHEAGGGEGDAGREVEPALRGAREDAQRHEDAPRADDSGADADREVGARDREANQGRADRDREVDRRRGRRRERNVATTMNAPATASS